MTELWERDAWELANEVRSGEVSSVELLDLFLARIERFDPELNAFCFVDVEGARRRATAIDARVAAGEDPGPWAGVPMGIKELAEVAGFPDTHASLLYRDQIAPRDGTEAARLCAAGAVLVGLTTSPEFGSTNWTRSYLHGVTRNPWHPERTPGGSSGGSAAAVASRHDADLLRQRRWRVHPHPRSYSGLFGFKVSFGRVGDRGAFDNGSCPSPVRCAARCETRRVTSTRSRARPSPTRRRCRARRASTRTCCSRVMRSRHCGASGWRGRRRSASRCATPTSRSSRRKPRTRSSPTPVSSSSRSTCRSRSRRVPGASSPRSKCRAITEKRARGRLPDITPVSRTASR